MIQKMPLEMSLTKRQIFCLGLNIRKNMQWLLNVCKIKRPQD